MKEVTTADSVVFLYRSGMGLSLLARRFLREVEQLRWMALNTEVFAEREQQSAAVFQVLAREVGRIASDVARAVDEVNQGAQRVASGAVESAARARLVEKYRQAQARGVTGDTGSRIEQRLGQEDRHLHGVFGTMATTLHRADAAFRAMDQLHRQLPLIGTLLRIESSRETANDGALLASGRAIDGLAASLRQLLDEVGRHASQTLHLLGQVQARSEKGQP